MGKYTSQTWGQKLRDWPGFKQLVGQVAMDFSVLISVYLPSFYVVKAFIFGETNRPTDWIKTGLGNYGNNYPVDIKAVASVWIPLDFICFSVPLYLRLPIRHAFSLVWTTFLSWLRGANVPLKKKEDNE